MKNKFTKILSLSFWNSVFQVIWRALCTVKFWKELVLITLGMFMGAASVYYFLMPSHLVVGSISGLSIVLNTLFGGSPHSFSVWVSSINAFLLILAFILIGNEFGLKTVYAAMILGPLVQFWDRVLPVTTFTHKVIQNPEILSKLQAGQTVLDAHNNPYLLSRGGEVLEQIKYSVMSSGIDAGDVWFDLLCFVLLLSVCQVFEFRLNASTGGLDIIAKIINKFLHFDIGTSVTIGGVIICCTAFLINDYRLVIIGLIGTWINGMVVDHLMDSLNRRKRVCIVTNQEENVLKYITSTIERGCSLYEVTGGYSGKKFTELQTIVTQDEYAKLIQYINDNKIHAFITAGNCSEIIGTWRAKNEHYASVKETPGQNNPSLKTGTQNARIGTPASSRQRDGQSQRPAINGNTRPGNTPARPATPSRPATTGFRPGNTPVRANITNTPARPAQTKPETQNKENKPTQPAGKPRTATPNATPDRDNKPLSPETKTANNPKNNPTGTRNNMGTKNNTTATQKQDKKE